jgi:hypothetical protein
VRPTTIEWFQKPAPSANAQLADPENPGARPDPLRIRGTGS